MSVDEGKNGQGIPKKLSQKLRWIGPSFIVAAAAVGSGEIINATRLGAIAGLVVLWVIFWGVFLKGFIQQEIGRYSLMTKKSITEGFADIPGPKLFGKSWFLYIFLALLAVVVLVIIAGVGGTVGGLLQSLFPSISASTWSILTNLVILGILLIGIYVPKWNIYSLIEKLMMLVIAGLTLIMLYIAFIALPQSDQYSYSMADLFSGMTFQLPEGSVLMSLAVLGTIGAGVELIFYSTWIISKGYVKHAYVDGDSATQKKERLKAWLSVLKLDTWLGVLLTFVITLAFFITGAIILKSANTVPDGVHVVEQISVIFTEVLGPHYYYLFMAGAFAGLFSTALAIADGAARMVVDLKREFSTRETTSKAQFKKTYSISAIIIVFSWIIFYNFVSAPTLLITVGGAALSLLFPLYGVALLYLNSQVPKGYQMHTGVKVILVICFILFSALWFVGELF
ncbi:Nramp family divalent metal transporter [Oceanobacillus senegalensis]|uniref:Nramp family divalent metal transporter n=1 Tax=Oceanobacillus senegalensis TaxID=1936063 RepID=UPI000A310E98|nr:Nramp family divalent metal transporter [Oceanobacillus senegalensis]